MAPKITSRQCHPAAYWDKELVVWEVRTGAAVCKLTHHDAFYAACFSPDGKFLLTSNGTFVNPQINYINSGVHLWEIATGKLLRTFAGLQRPAKTVAFAGNGSILACTSTILMRWDDASGQVIGTSRFRGVGFEYPAFSRDAEICLVPTSGSFAVWRTRDGEKIGQFPDHGTPIRTGGRGFGYSRNPGEAAAT